MAKERTDGRVQTLAEEPVPAGDGDTKKYLDYDGLAYLVEKLTNRIEAVGGDGKYLPLAGGTVTGNLTVNGDTDLGDVSAGKVEADSLSTDNVRITDNSVYVDGGGVTADTGGFTSLNVGDDLTAKDVTAEEVHTNELEVECGDEEELADIPYVLGLNRNSHAVKVPVSEFNKGTGETATSVDVRCWVGDPDDSRVAVSYVRDGAAATANFEEGGTVTADVWSVITVTGTHSSYVSQTVSYVVTSALTNIMLRLEED